MRAIRVVLATTAILISWSTANADAQTAIVPETTYSFEPTSMTSASTASVDADSVIVTFTEHPGSGLLGTAKFMVVNVNSGAIEVAPTILPGASVSPDPTTGMRGASVAAITPTSALIALRDDTPAGGRRGHYFVVNTETGAIVRGPVLFTSSGTFWEYRMTVVDSSTVLIAHRSDDQLKGMFTVIDPQTGTVRIPETPFEPAETNTMEVAALDARHVVVAYGTPGPDLQMFSRIIDPEDGTVSERLALDGAAPIALLKRSSVDVVLVYVARSSGPAQFATLNPFNGVLSNPTTYANQLTFVGGPTLLNASTIFLPFVSGATASGDFAVYGLNGSVLVPSQPFNPEGPAYVMSSAALNCRVLLSYQDVPDGQKGKFQILDFSDTCAPPPCPTDLTGRVNIFRSGLVPFLVPSLQLQLVLIHNPTPDAFRGPLAFVTTDLQNGLLFSATVTRCASSTLAQYVVFHPGADEILSPGEVAGGFLLFLKTSPDPITYVPHLLAGLWPR